jgi:hypothetical protein
LNRGATGRRVATDRVASPIGATQCFPPSLQHLTSWFRSNKLPVAFSDNESPSDAELEQTSTKKAAVRGRKSANDASPEDEDDDVASTDDKNGDAGADDEEAGDDDEDMDEEVYGQQDIILPWSWCRGR